MSLDSFLLCSWYLWWLFLVNVSNVFCETISLGLVKSSLQCTKLDQNLNSQPTICRLINNNNNPIRYCNFAERQLQLADFRSKIPPLADFLMSILLFSVKKISGENFQFISRSFFLSYFCAWRADFVCAESLASCIWVVTAVGTPTRSGFESHALPFFFTVSQIPGNRIVFFFNRKQIFVW